MVDTISYTGWKLVCVMPYSIFTNKMADVKQFVFCYNDYYGYDVCVDKQSDIYTYFKADNEAG